MNRGVTARGHLVVAVLAAGALPAGSLVAGSGLLAFRMYASSPALRVQVTAWDRRDVARPVSPTALAARAGGTLGDALAGSDRWKLAPSDRLLASHVGELAELACVAARGAARVEVRLERRASSGAPLQTSIADRSCP